MATLTVYPDPSTGATTVDGRVSRYGVDETLGTIRAGAGNSHNDTGTGAQVASLTGSSTSNQYSGADRFMMTFDTSALTASATISAAVLSILGSGKTDGLLGETSANSVAVLVAATPASNNDLVDADYSQVGTTDFGRSVQQNSWSTSAYNDITLSASGIANISKTGISKFATRYGWDFDNTTTGLTWADTATQEIVGVSADTADVTSDPKLVITYTISTGVSPRPTLLLMGVG